MKIGCTQDCGRVAVYRGLCKTCGRRFDRAVLAGRMTRAESEAKRLPRKQGWASFRRQA